MVAPSVSTADSRSISAFWRAMRHIPRASASVATIGSPSGNRGYRQSDRRLDDEERRPCRWRAPAAGDHRRDGRASPRRAGRKAARAAAPAARFPARPPRPTGRCGQARSLNPGRDRHADGAAARDRRALEEHRGAVGRAAHPPPRRSRDLSTDHRFSGERRLVGGRDARSRAAAGRPRPHRRLPAARCRRARARSAGTTRAHGRPGARRAERVPSARSASIERAALISVDEADQGIEAEHGADGGAFLQFAEIDRKHRRRGEQIDDGAGELMQQDR